MRDFAVLGLNRANDRFREHECLSNTNGRPIDFYVIDDIAVRKTSKHASENSVSYASASPS